ncbi:BZ3500_MvSof-1268-A1-R1_C039g00071 [Microbotryum saponariae]|uniref:BZ3500_MvSof-1268-A1-R1_C039g00071 protein n=1 Tax=Microbotryum saponariae TaxID=289078 RepID=A0A2X0L9C8_9BASI|nr:BZ3500_MvSof-1268-A1-R1_C039g00071 [Microbotryum saponariae]
MSVGELFIQIVLSSCPIAHSCLSLLLITLVQIARWPTRWQPSFAPNRSVTCKTILCASLISTIEEALNFAEVSN